MSGANDVISMIDVEAILNKTFKSEVTDILSIPTAQENVDFTPPSDGSEYVKLTVNYAQASRDSKTVSDRKGIATAQIFTPLGTATGRAIEIAETIRKAFGNAEWAARVITVTAIDIAKIGRSGSMYQTNVVIYFRYFESVTN